MKSTDKQFSKDVYVSLSTIYTHGTEVATVVTKAMPVLRKLLNVSPAVTVRVAPIKGKHTNGRYWSGQKLIEVDCRLDWAKALEVLCHEMVHAEQYHEGRLEHTGRMYKWNGQLNSNRGTTYNAYREQPWEQEAFARQAVLAKQVNEILEAQAS